MASDALVDPVPSSELVRLRMQNTKQRDTPREMALRQALHARGLRYRVDRPIPGVTRGRPDLLFPTEKVAVFVDGCFWHSCPEHSTVPRSNKAWWVAKLEANVERDRRHTEELRSAGWEVIRFWEHEDMSKAAADVQATVYSRR